MGGYGSSRWGFYRKRDTVEACRALSIRDLVRHAGLAPNMMRVSGIAWYDSATGEKTSAIGVHILTTDTGGWARLFYQVTPNWGRGEPFDIDYKVPLVTTRPHLGGLRWWFHCPGKGCGRRVGVLYFPPGDGVKYYLCRHCYDLAYRSSQTHDKSRDRFKRMNWDTLMTLVQAGDTSLLTALKAADEALDRIGRRR
jgi:hypothetical protein